MTKAAKKSECGDLQYLLNELAVVAPHLKINELAIDECVYKQTPDQQYQALAKLFEVNIGDIYLLSFNMYYFNDYKRGGVKRQNFNANLNGLLNFSEKANSQAQTDAYLDSGDNHWQLSMPCYAGKSYKSNHTDFLQKLVNNMQSLVTKTTNDILIVDLKSRKYLIHKTPENHAINKLLEEKFPLLKKSPTLNMVDIDLKLQCIKELNITDISLNQCAMYSYYEDDRFSEFRLERFIPFRFYYRPAAADTFGKLEAMILDIADSKVFKLSYVLETWLNNSIDEYDLTRWLTIRHIEQFIDCDEHSLL